MSAIAVTVIQSITRPASTIANEAARGEKWGSTANVRSYRSMGAAECQQSLAQIYWTDPRSIIQGVGMFAAPRRFRVISSGFKAFASRVVISLCSMGADLGTYAPPNRTTAFITGASSSGHPSYL